MTSTAQFDPNALAAVKPGLDTTLAEISAQMERFLGDPSANAAALETTRTELHRLMGVLKMVGLDGASVFCSELEIVLGEFAAGSQQVSSLHRDVLHHALFAITHFLDSLANGTDNASLRLFPQYQELQNLRGMEMSFELDLFFPNLVTRLPQQVLSELPQGEARHLKVLRGQYQQGLMKWLRQEDVPNALQKMQDALHEVLQSMPQDSDSRAFWWIACGFMECMQADKLPQEYNARKLLGSIDQHLRAVAESGNGDPIPVINEMLYQIGHCHDVSEMVEEIRQIYVLDNYLLELSVLPPSEVAQLLSVLRDQLRVAQDSWELCVQDDEGACKKFIEYAEHLAEQSEKLDRNTLQYLTKQIQILSEYASVPEHAQPIAMDMAMALLLLGSGIENYSQLGSGFQEQARILSERMQAAVKQQPEDSSRMLELVSLHGLMEQSNAMVPLANEMLMNLQHVEQGLSAYFLDTTEREQMNELLRQLVQIQGGLHMLSLDPAEQLLQGIKGYVRRFAQGEITRSVENHALADGVSALENYLQHLTHRQIGDVSLLEKAAEAMLQSRKAAEEMRAAEAERNSEQTQEKIETPEPAQEIVPESPMAFEPAKVSAPLPSQMDEDQELLDIFLEEAQEVLGVIRKSLELSQLHPNNRDTLVSIRRGFHTLKGSGRMVGLGDFGEVAWCVERAMNRWLEDNSKAATPGLLHFLAQAVESFTTWVGELKKQGVAVIEAEILVADALKIEASRDAEIVVVSSDAQVDAETATEVESLLDIKFPDFASSPEQAETEVPAVTSEPSLEIDIEVEADSAPEAMSAVDPAAETTSELAQLLDSLPEFTVAPTPEPPFQISAETDSEISLTYEIPEGLDEAIALEPEALPTMEFIPALEQQQTDVPSESEPEPEFAVDDAHDLAADVAVKEDSALSPALYKIAATEAMQNVAVLHEQFSELCAAVPPVVHYDFMRAAHTLGGVNRTMGFAPVVELAHALEGWLQARIEQPFTLSDDQLQLLLESITALDEMVQCVSVQQVPELRSDLASQLLADKSRLGEVAQLPEPAPKPAPPKLSDLPPASMSIPVPVARAAVPLPPAADKPQVRDDVDEQLLPLFIEEADDLCPMIGTGLRSWREHPHDDLQLQSFRRLLHTMKGSSRMVGAMRIGEIAHEMEERVLGAAQLRNAAGYWEALENDFDQISALLEELRSGKTDTAKSRRRGNEHQGDDRRKGRRILEVGAERMLASNMLRVRSDVVDRLVNEASEISVTRLHMETELRSVKEGLLDLSMSVTRLRQQLREIEIQAESQMQAHVSFSKEGAETFDPLEFDRFTRLQELTRFMNESVHDVQTVQQTLLKNLDVVGVAMVGQARMNRELQQGLMNVRMVPFNSIADRLYRIVRQTGKEINKRANLELLGATVELDRSVLEKMTAPFEHLLRNAMVHGLEEDQQRALSGKTPIGEIRLSVHQESNEVVFDLSDDGAGLNVIAIREKAVAKGLLGAGEAVSDAQLTQLIFATGLSTAGAVTEIAGRGVGMDVVRNEIAALGGRIDVSSKTGKGTNFIIHLPLTLAVMQALLVRSGDQIYAIPSTMVEQVNQVRSEDMLTLHRDRQVGWQGKTYPLHYLPHLLGDTERELENLPRNSVLLLRSGEQRVALHVDELQGNQEVVVKNIGPQLARLAGVSGATILGNGKVVLILNPTQLAQRISPASQDVRKADVQASVKSLHSQALVMVVDDSLTVRKVTTRMLVRAGYQVVTAKDGIDALELLEQYTPQVMLLDIEMPRMDGFALARELRHDPKTKHLPIIMITSRTADKHRDYAKQLGINSYLGKPYQEDILLQNIADFVAVHKLDA